MDINTLRGLATILVMIAFLGICWWAFSPRRKKRFKEAANLPFADELQNHQPEKQAAQKKQQNNSEEPAADKQPHAENSTAKQG